MNAQQIANKLMLESPHNALEILAQAMRLVATDLAVRYEPPRRVAARDAPTIVRDVVCAYFGLSEHEMMGECHALRISRPRHVAMWLMRTRVGMSYPEIARYFGRDHTTIMQAVKRVGASQNKHVAILMRKLDAVEALPEAAQ